MVVQWLCDLTYTQQTIAADVFPAAVASIAEYINSKEKNYEARIYKYPERLAEDFKLLEPPDIISFSYYVWNSYLSESFAKAIKTRFPKTIVIFGGPSYPVEKFEREKFLTERPYIDYFIRHEGEISMQKIVHSLEYANTDLTGVDYINSEGSFVAAPETSKIKNLEELPSPYLSGRLDEFFDGKLTPIIQTNRGCPFTCTFCVEGTEFYSNVSFFSRDKIDKELIYIAKKMNEKRSEYKRNDLFIADSNFGMYPADLKTCHTLQHCRETYKWPDYINVATGKNAKKRVLEAAKIIDGALRLSGSVQSLDPEVLENIKRTNIDVGQLYELGLEAGKTGANTYSEVILGLPGDSKEGHLKTLKTVIDAGFNQIQPFQLMILPGTPMSAGSSKKSFELQTRFRVLPRCYGTYPFLDETIIAAEIEEVCVGCARLSFLDYLECRKFHLTIAAFYNDSVFGSFLRLIKSLGLSIFDWLEKINDSTLMSGLSEVYDSFLDFTESELWDNKEDLRDFCSDKETISDFVDGKIGNNLIFVHRGKLLCYYLRQMSDVALDSLIDLLNSNGINCSPAQIDLLHELADYQVMRGTDIFDGPEIISTTPYKYFVEQFEDQVDSFEFPQQLLRGSPASIMLEQPPAQREVLMRMKDTFGDSAVGVGRILTKIHIKNLFRNCLSDSLITKQFLQSRVALEAQGISE